MKFKIRLEALNTIQVSHCLLILKVHLRFLGNAHDQIRLILVEHGQAQIDIISGVGGGGERQELLVWQVPCLLLKGVQEVTACQEGLLVEVGGRSCVKISGTG